MSVKKELRLVGKLAFCLFLLNGDPLGEEWPKWVQFMSLTLHLIASILAFWFALRWWTFRDDEA